MRIGWAGWIGLLTLSNLSFAADVAATTEPEVRWESAYLDGTKIGTLRTIVKSEGAEGESRLRTTHELQLAFRRQGAQLQLRMEHGVVELADGRVVAVFMRQHQGNGHPLQLDGQLEQDKMRVVIDRGRVDRIIRWHPDVVGLHRQERLYGEQKMKAGDRFAFLSYEPTVNAVVTRRATAIGPESVLTANGRRELLRVEISTDRIEVPGVSLQLPTTVLWLDEQYAIQRRQMELDGLGKVIFLRSKPDEARTTTVAEVRGADIGMKSLIPLSRPVPRLHTASSALYRIVLEGESDAAGAFVSDSHQTVRQQVGPALDLQVHPIRGLQRSGAEKPGPECLGSSYYLDSDDQRILETARRIAGRENDAWAIALRIERWAHQTIRPDPVAPLAPASQVLRSPRGDCRHYAILTAALCRAAGIPSRTALGLVYVERDQKPFLGFHMWTEVCIDGQWRGLDAAFGRGGVGAGHVKVSDHSWHDTRSLTPLIPAQRILGKATVTVLRVEHGG